MCFCFIWLFVANKTALGDVFSSVDKSKVQEAWAISNVLAHEPISMDQATQRAVKILDANYKKADLQTVVTNCTQLNSVEKNKLLELLKKF